MSERRDPPPDGPERPSTGGRSERERSEPGWRVTPVPDGRGTPKAGEPEPHWAGRWWLLALLVDIARRMVARWGMSETIGPMVTQGSDADGPLLPDASDASPDTQRLVDEEVRRILTAAHSDVTELLSRHREQLDTLAHALLEHETLDGPAAYRAAGAPAPALS
jgi:hypothetical protein